MCHFLPIFPKISQISQNSEFPRISENFQIIFRNFEKPKTEITVLVRKHHTFCTCFTQHWTLKTCQFSEITNIVKHVF